jgi:hypothetical protein
LCVCVCVCVCVRERERELRGIFLQWLSFMLVIDRVCFVLFLSMENDYQPEPLGQLCTLGDHELNFQGCKVATSL